MKLSIVVLRHVKYDGLSVHILTATETWDTKDPATKLENTLKSGYYVQLSPIMEIEFPERSENEVIPEILAGLDIQEANERRELEDRIEPIRRRRRELQQLTFQSAPGQEFIPADRASSIPSADDHEE